MNCSYKNIYKKVSVSLTKLPSLFVQVNFNRGIKHDFPFINIRKVPRVVLKTEDEARGFLTFPMDLANVNEWQNHV